MNRVGPKAFIQARKGAYRQEFLTQSSVEDLRDHKLYLSQDKKTGYAISPEGDLQSLFNYGEPGEGARAVWDALLNGAQTLDCFDGFLVDYYKQFGFEEYKRITFEPQYAPEDWDYETYGSPDVVYMKIK